MKRTRVLLVTTIVVLLSFTVIACSRAKSDAQIIGEVVTKINADSQVANKQIAVSSTNGVVTLTGSASNDAERAAIAGDAAQVDGVRTVVNNLLVASAPQAAQEADAPQQTDEQQETPAAVEKASPMEKAVPARSRKPSAYRERTVAKTTDTYMPPVASTPASYSSPASYSAPVSAPAQVAVASAPATPAPPPAPTPMTIEAGTTISVRMTDSINSGRNHQGDIWHGTLDAPLMVGETVVVPEGTDVQGRVAEVKDAGHFAGQPELALELTNISANGRKYSVVTDQYREQGKSRGASTAKTVGTGAAIGGIIGAIAGGGKGAAIGAAAGAGMGGGVQATRKAEEVHIATEALVTFRLQNDLTMTPTPQSQRRRLDDASTSSAPQQYDNNNKNYTDYSDNSDRNSSDRPVLKRRGPGADQN